MASAVAFGALLLSVPFPLSADGIPTDTCALTGPAAVVDDEIDITINGTSDITPRHGSPHLLAKITEHHFKGTAKDTSEQLILVADDGTFSFSVHIRDDETKGRVHVRLIFEGDPGRRGVAVCEFAWVVTEVPDTATLAGQPGASRDGLLTAIFGSALIGAATMLFSRLRRRTPHA